MDARSMKLVLLCTPHRQDKTSVLDAGFPILRELYLVTIDL